MVLRSRRASRDGVGHNDHHSARFVYAYDAYIDPAYRNTGVWLRFKAYLAEWMGARQAGVLTFVDYGNLASLRTHLRFGFEPSSTVFAVKAFGRTFFKRRNLSNPSRSVPPRHVVPSSQ